MTNIRLEELLVYEDWLRRLAWHLLGYKGEPDDFVQETFFKAIRNKPKNRRNLKGWLGTILRNSIKNQTLSDGRRFENEKKFAETKRLGESDLEPSQLMEKIEAERLLSKTLLGLKEPYRTVLVYYYHEKLTTAQIAERLGRSEGTIRSQHNRGLNKLKDALPGGQDSWRDLCKVLIFGGVGVGYSPIAPSDGGGLASDFLSVTRSYMARFGFRLTITTLVVWAGIGIGLLVYLIARIQEGKISELTSEANLRPAADLSNQESLTNEIPETNQIDSRALSSNEPRMRLDNSRGTTATIRKFPVKILADHGRSLVEVLAEQVPSSERIVPVLVVTKDPPPMEEFSATETWTLARDGLGRYRTSVLEPFDDCPDGYDGVLEVKVQPPYYLSLVLGNSILESRAINSEQTELEFRVAVDTLKAHLSEVCIQVLDPDGIPVTSSMHIMFGPRDSVWPGNLEEDVVCFQSIPPGNYLLSLRPKDQNSTNYEWHERVLKVRPQREKPSLRTIQLDAARTISGIVVNETGKPVSGIALGSWNLSEAVTYPQHLYSRFRGRGVTDDAGRFTLFGIGPEAQVIMQKSQSPWSATAVLVEDLSETVAGLQIEISIGVSVALVPQWDDLKAVFVTIRGQASGPYPIWTEWMHGGDSGKTVRLRPGQYTLDISDEMRHLKSLEIEITKETKQIFLSNY